MSTKAEKVKYAIYNNPLLINTLLRDTSINKGMIHRLLHKAIPCRIGIEFELAGVFTKGFNKKYNKNLNDSNKNTMLTKFYEVKEINEDPVDYNNEEDALREIRISIDSPKQLVGLYVFMQDLSEFCRLHQNGGIHIHVDISQLALLSQTKELCQRYIKNRLTEVGKIFPKYTGKYNKRQVGISYKSTWVNISIKKSLEFRIAPLTFNYSTLVGWIRQLIVFRQNLVRDCKLKKVECTSGKTVGSLSLTLDSTDPLTSIGYVELREAASTTSSHSDYVIFSEPDVRVAGAGNSIG